MWRRYLRSFGFDWNEKTLRRMLRANYVSATPQSKYRLLHETKGMYYHIKYDIIVRL